MTRTPRPFLWRTPETRAADAAPGLYRHRRHMIDRGERFPTWDPGEVYRALVALGPTPTREQVDAAIGNASWTSTKCDHCGARDVPVVELGQEPDYESATADVCAECLREALGALGEP